MAESTLVYEGHPVAPRIDASVVEGTRAIGYYSEYMRGENLKALLEKGALTSHQKKEIFRQVSDQIRLLHGAGKYHGDLKASNVMVEIKKDKKMVVRLIDFFGPLTEGPPETGIRWDVADLEILMGHLK